MTSPLLTEYLNRVADTHSSGTYVARRFSVAKDNRGTEEDLGYQFRGVMRDREPELSELLKHQRMIVVGEPGAGKSVVAHAAVRTLIEERERVPVYGELKQYRKATNLVGLLKGSAPAEVLEIGHLFEGKAIARTYVLDGVDEVPAEMLTAFGKDLGDLLRNDKEARIFLTSRQAFYAAHRESLPDISSVFYIVDLSDEDIRELVGYAGIDYDTFPRDPPTLNLHRSPKPITNQPYPHQPNPTFPNGQGEEENRKKYCERKTQHAECLAFFKKLSRFPG
jgi:hypothetical protein